MALPKKGKKRTFSTTSQWYFPCTPWKHFKEHLTITFLTGTFSPMILRERDHNGNQNLRLKMGDLPSFNLGDERVVLSAGGVLLGSAVGAVIATACAQKRVTTLRRHLLTARNEVESTRKIAKNDISLAKQFGTTSVFKDLLLTCDNIDRALASSSSGSDPTRHSHTQSPLAVSESSSLSTLRSGIQLSQQELLKVLSKHGVSAIPVAVGDQFDPDVCEAMLSQPIPSDSREGGHGCGTDAIESAGKNESRVSECEILDGSVENCRDCDKGAVANSKVTIPVPVAGAVSEIFLPGYRMHGRVLRAARVGVWS